VSTGGHYGLRDAQELRHQPGCRPVWPRSMINDPTSGRRKRAEHNAGDADIAKAPGTKAMPAPTCTSINAI
jgi:hypothetical protein